MATSVLLADATKVVHLTAHRGLLDGGKVRLRDEFEATLVDVVLDNPAGTLTGTTLNLTVPVTGTAVLSGVAVDAVMLTSADVLVAGPIPVLLKDSVDYDAAVAAGEIYIYIESSTTLVSGAVVTLLELPHVMLDPVP